jgi:hypothetical protein
MGKQKKKTSGGKGKSKAGSLSSKAKISKSKSPAVSSAVAACPVFRISKAQFPGHAQLLENAQTQGISLKGLTRLTGKNNIRRNRRRSQAPIRKAKGPPPAGHDYDEFPYASTHQGGTGARVEANVSADNQGAGRALGAFYRTNNIGEGDSFDVEIDP